MIYLVPRNGRDRGLDTTGTLAISVGMFQQWLFQERSVTLREDLYQGTLDITFFRSQKTDAQIASFGRFVLNVLYAELKAAGFDRPEAKYLIYYDGSNPLTCGNALQDGPAAAVYLRGSRGGKSCGGSFVFRPGDPPGYWEFAMLHEVLHTLGAVHFNAPHHDDSRRRHVTERQDLMYGGGDDAWSPGYIDQDSDDYFGSELPPWIRDVMRDPILVSPLGPSPDRARARRVNPPSFPPLVDDVIEPA